MYDYKYYINSNINKIHIVVSNKYMAKNTSLYKLRKTSKELTIELLYNNAMELTHEQISSTQRFVLFAVLTMWIIFPFSLPPPPLKEKKQSSVSRLIRADPLYF